MLLFASDQDTFVLGRLQRAVKELDSQSILREQHVLCAQPIAELALFEEDVQQLGVAKEEQPGICLTEAGARIKARLGSPLIVELVFDVFTVEEEGGQPSLMQLSLQLQLLHEEFALDGPIELDLAGNKAVHNKRQLSDAPVEKDVGGGDLLPPVYPENALRVDFPALVVVYLEPELVALDDGRVVPVLESAAHVHHDGGQFVVSGGVRVGETKFRGEGDVVVQFDQLFAGEAVGKALHVHEKRRGQLLERDDAAGVLLALALIAKELVVACHIFGAKVVPDAVVEGAAALDWQTQVHRGLFPTILAVAGRAADGVSLDHFEQLADPAASPALFQVLVQVVQQEQQELVRVVVLNWPERARGSPYLLQQGLAASLGSAFVQGQLFSQFGQPGEDGIGRVCAADSPEGGGEVVEGEEGLEDGVGKADVAVVVEEEERTQTQSSTPVSAHQVISQAADPGLQLMKTKNVISRTMKPPKKGHQQIIEELENKYKREPFVELAHEVLEMFENEYNEQLQERKAAAMVKYAKGRKEGFFYQQIESLRKIVEYATGDLFRGVEEMVGAIIKLLEVSNPVKKNFFNIYNNSDELKYLPLVPDFLNTFIPLLEYEKHSTLPLEPLRFAVISFLNRFAKEGINDIIRREESFQNKRSEGTETSPMQILLLKGTKSLRTIQHSRLIDPIVAVLHKYQQNYEFLFPLLELCSNCLLFRNLALAICEKGVLQLIVSIVFECPDFRSSIVKLCLDIIWNAIDALGVQQIIPSFARRETIANFKQLFGKVMAEGYKLEDKCLRNQLLILINYLMGDAGALAYFLEKEEGEVSFLECLLGCATVDEQTLTDPNYKMADKKAEYGTNIEDLQFKKLVWSGIQTAIQSDQPRVLATIKEVNFIKYLLLYIDPMTTSYAVTRWSAPQLREIQLHCLAILANLICFMKDDFEEKKGLFCLTKFLANTNDPERRELCLRAFNNASRFEEQYKLKISEEGVMDNLIQFLQHNEENPLDIKELCFSIISNLCRDCPKNKKLFRSKGGIDLIIANLKDPNLATSARYMLFAVSILDCLWNAILGSRKSESQFLDNEGLYVLLQFLQICDNLLKKLALSCLSYLIENPKSINFFCDWSSESTMINATQLMIRIYSKEDERFGVKYEEGIIANFRRPLTPNQAVVRLAQNKSIRPNRTASNIGEFNDAGTQTYLIHKIRECIKGYDLRAIVFSILYRTGFDKNDLEASEQQMVEVIQMYPHFRVGEIWSDIEEELRQEDKRPTFDDRHWMATCIEQFEEQVLNCVNTQSLINRQFRKMQEEDLDKFLNVIKINKITK